MEAYVITNMIVANYYAIIVRGNLIDHKRVDLVALPIYDLTPYEEIQKWGILTICTIHGRIMYTRSVFMINNSYEQINGNMYRFPCYQWYIHLWEHVDEFFMSK